jgi:hypothetical protein
MFLVSLCTPAFDVEDQPVKMLLARVKAKGGFDFE